MLRVVELELMPGPAMGWVGLPNAKPFVQFDLA